MDISILMQERLMVIIRHKAFFNVKGLCTALLNAECSIMEIALNTPGSLALIEEARKEFSCDMLVGAGTVLTVSDAEQAIAAGAQYIVSPVLREDVTTFCVNRGVPVFPGVATPTEAYSAHMFGATMVKLFPASVFGPGYISAIKAPLPDIKVLAVGGVSADNVGLYVASGADAVAVGSGSIKPEHISSENWPAITADLAKVKAHIKAHINRPAPGRVGF